MITTCRILWTPLSRVRLCAGELNWERLVGELLADPDLLVTATASSTPTAENAATRGTLLTIPMGNGTLQRRTAS